jgi:hypothetical protein
VTDALHHHHSHHGHDHPPRRPHALDPSASLLRTSVAARLGGVALVAAALWAAVLWAMT